MIKRRDRGFAIIVALGVMVVLTIMAFSAAAISQFTYAFSRARVADRQMADVLRDSIQVLERRSVPEPGSPTIELLRTQSASKRDIQVSATVQMMEVGAQLLGRALKLREGDRVVELTAASAPGWNVTRGAVYLVNVRGARTAPILLVERRS